MLRVVTSGCRLSDRLGRRRRCGRNDRARLAGRLTPIAVARARPSARRRARRRMPCVLRARRLAPERVRSPALGPLLVSWDRREAGRRGSRSCLRVGSVDEVELLSPHACGPLRLRSSVRQILGNLVHPRGQFAFDGHLRRVTLLSVQVERNDRPEGRPDRMHTCALLSSNG